MSWPLTIRDKAREYSKRGDKVPTICVLLHALYSVSVPRSTARKWVQQDQPSRADFDAQCDGYLDARDRMGGGA